MSKDGSPIEAMSEGWLMYFFRSSFCYDGILESGALSYFCALLRIIPLVLTRLIVDFSYWAFFILEMYS
jgi:hypothetical protein